MPYQVKRYLGHISGPILDRIDLVTQTTPVKNPLKKPDSEENPFSDEKMKKQVLLVRNIQKERYSELFGKEMTVWNGKLSQREITKICVLDAEGEKLFDKLVEKFELSGRAIHSLLKVARTIADLEGQEKISADHLAEAVGYKAGFERYFHV